MANNSDTDQIIDTFIDSIWLEQGLSKSTLSAYRSDIKVLGKWASSKRLKIEDISRADLLDFIADKAHSGSVQEPQRECYLHSDDSTVIFFKRK